jgi:hypothetical protein
MQDVLAAKYKPVPDGKGGIEYVPENQQTLDFSTLGKRFKDFGLPLDQKALEELNRVRNDIEQPIPRRLHAVHGSTGYRDSLGRSNASREDGETR